MLVLPHPINPIITIGFGGIKLTNGDAGLDGIAENFSGPSLISSYQLQKEKNTHTRRKCDQTRGHGLLVVSANPALFASENLSGNYLEQKEPKY
jgi:hypothetical protein